ncbi:MAG: DUF2058 family protein [Lysobacteraceae bacterium]
MTDSLRDQLLKLGFRKPEPVARDASKQAPSRKAAASGHRPGRSEDRGAGRNPPSGGNKPVHGQHARAPDREHTSRSSTVRRAASLPKRTQEEIDLGKAYALRAQHEKNERIDTERLKQEAARIKREAKAKVAELLKDQSLNLVDAELTRHFEYNGKIRRVHVTEAQLKSINAGELGVVQLDGRYLLVADTLAREVEALLPSLLALLVDPDAPVANDPYADPQFKVPDDLVW